MIFVRATATDNNENPASSDFVGIPTPVGVQDGDLILVAITLPDPDVTVTPPDESWTEIVQTDPAVDLSIIAFWKTALNEGARWVFTLSASSPACGLAAVYGGVDGFEPVEAKAIALTAGPTMTHDVPAITLSEGDEELVLFLAADTSGGFSVGPSGYVRLGVDAVQTGNATTSAWHRQPSSAGTQPASTATAGIASDGAALIIALRPSVGKLSVDDVRRRIVSGFPSGVEDVYDLEPGGDYYKLFQAIAQVFKIFAFDAIDLARREIIPAFAKYKLVDWERIFGVATSRTARAGTIPQRRAQVVSRWREAAGIGSTFDAVTAILGPILGYLPSTEVEVFECSRSALDILHSYTDNALMSIPDAGTGEAAVIVPEGGTISLAGVRLTIQFAANVSGAVQINLRAPNGDSRTWQVIFDDEAMRVFYAPELAGIGPTGAWKLTVENGTGGTIDFLWSFVVEGIGPGQSTAGAIFHWGAYADPAHLGENGTPADFDAARAAVRRLTFAHCKGALLQSITPYPGETSGLNAAIPGECIPTL